MLRSAARLAQRTTVNAWYSLCKFPRARFAPSVHFRGSGDFGIGERVYVGSRTILSAPAGATLELHAGAFIGSDCELSAGGRIEIGERTSLRPRCELHGDVTMGSGCTVAPNLYISSGWHEFARAPQLPIRIQDYRKARAPLTERSKPVWIGDDCWFGINVVVAPGVTVGRGCIIGANSVVTRNIPPYTIAAGAPARPLKARLEFAPPEALDAASDADLPYFYSGFRQLAATEEGDAAPVRVRGGWPAWPEFVLALAARPGAAIAVGVDALQSGRLTHKNQIREIQPGAAEVSFSVSPDADGLLRFAWQSQRQHSPDGLVIKGVRPTS